MRKLLILGVLAFAGFALADMDDKVFPVATTVAASATTNTINMRGELFGIYVDVGTATTRTQTVVVATAQQTLLNKAVVADTWFPLEYPLYGSTGSALTFVGGTNDTANPWYGKAPLAGPVTCTVTGGNGAGVTNTTTVTVIYDRK